MPEVINRLSLREFEKIFNSLYPQLCYFANRYVNSIKDSEDIVQNVFLKVWEKKLYFENTDKAEGFLYTAVKNKSLDFLKSKYSKDIKCFSSEELEILQTDEYFMTEFVIVETSALIEKAINSLPPQPAKVIRLSMSGLANKEIADKMAISVNTVKQHKQKAYKKFREDLGDLTIK